MADIDITATEKFNYEITVYDEDGLADLSAFTTRRIDVRPADFTGSLLIDSLAVTFVTDGTDGKINWVVDPSDFTSQPAGTAYAQLTFIGGGDTKKTRLLTVMIHRSIE